MADQPLSVVVPTHDTRDMTLRCLTSVMSAGSDLEVIVVDDASTDGSATAISRRFPRAKLLVNRTRTGFSKSVNRGVADAEGDPLLILNSDTEVTARAIAAVRAAFVQDPKLGIAGAELQYPDGTMQWSAGQEPSSLWLFGQASGLPAFLGGIPGYRIFNPPGRSADDSVDWVSGAAMAVRRQVWQEVGPFDEGYHFYCQDMELCLAAKDAGWRVELVPSFEVIHHHGGTISGARGSAAPYHPELMWTDLVRFARRRGGDEAARSAANALRRGARLRLFGRTLTGLILGGSRPATWRRDTEAFEEGLRALMKIED